MEMFLFKYVQHCRSAHKKFFNVLHKQSTICMHIKKATIKL